MAGIERPKRMGYRLGSSETQQEGWTLALKDPVRKCNPGFGSSIPVTAVRVVGQLQTGPQ